MRNLMLILNLFSALKVDQILSLFIWNKEFDLYKQISF